MQIIISIIVAVKQSQWDEGKKRIFAGEITNFFFKILIIEEDYNEYTYKLHRKENIILKVSIFFVLQIKINLFEIVFFIFYNLYLLLIVTY